MICNVWQYVEDNSGYVVVANSAIITIEAEDILASRVFQEGAVDMDGDEGADTLGHIAELCAAGKANSSCRSHSGPLHIPNLARLGLAEAAKESRGKPIPYSGKPSVIDGVFGYAQEISSGKDTPSGHWEICGLPVLFDWGMFPNTANCFPESILEEIISKANIPGSLANCHASGTKVLENFGEEHMKTGKPIFYTSADSVFQIACHEGIIPIDEIYKICDKIPNN
jgi:phosphopentomutase